MLERIARTFHVTLGVAAIFLSAVHILSVTTVSENPGGLWLLGLAVLIPGAFVAASGRKLEGSAVVATGALALVSLIELSGFHATMPALFTIGAGVDALLLSLHLGRRGRWAGLGAALLVCAVVALGLGDALFSTVPIDP